MLTLIMLLLTFVGAAFSALWFFSAVAGFIVNLQGWTPGLGYTCASVEKDLGRVGFSRQAWEWVVCGLPKSGVAGA